MLFPLLRDEAGAITLTPVAGRVQVGVVLSLSRKKGPLSDRQREGLLQPERDLVIDVGFGRCSLVEGAGGENLLIAGVGYHKPSGLIPVVVPDGVRVFGVGSVIFAGEDLRFLLEPASLQSQDLGVLGRELQFGGSAVIQRDVIL